MTISLKDLDKMAVGSTCTIGKKKSKKKKNPKSLDNVNVDTSGFEDVTDEEVLKNIPI